jgi:hypothetical protein
MRILMLKKNVGTLDKTIRLAVSAVMVVWLLAGGPIFGSYILTVIVGVLALMNAISGLFSVCVVYRLFDISTYKKVN